ncbi:hypothetical protein Vretimale_5349 [Volvox reticuliferus]|uniref:CBM20 domain-containing protein n=1 Tax=Volvox reticuliferus TaxID=1737510 RepID=A0A8J4DIA2_9CHLO|nr:hypothetical protein Vretimale_5349 [Volvox reticuliferus]
MVLDLGSYQLSTKSLQLGSAPIPVHRQSRRAVSIGVRLGRVLDVNVMESGQSKRYRPCQVFALKAESPRIKRFLDPTDSLTHHSDLIRYRFVVPQYITTFGQTLRVVGSLPELGGWNPCSAPVMTWSDGHQWSLECILPQRPFEFKITVFEGHTVKWEGGSNRVVHAEDAGGDNVPVEIVVWLTCNFNATASTQMQLAVPRASIQDAYETGMATLEFLKLRKSKLGHDTEQGLSSEVRRQHTTELARLSEAVAEQSTVVHQLSDWLGHEAVTSQGASRQNGSSSKAAYTEDEENSLLLLAIDSVRVPRALRRIAFVQPSWASGSTTALSSGNGVEKSDGSEEIAAPADSPFLRGELDSRAEDIISAAEVLLQELKSSSPDEQQASLEWASLAQEAGQVAVALEALAGADSPVDHAVQRQLRQLAGVGCELAGSSVAQDESAMTTILAMANTSATPEVATVFREEVIPLRGPGGEGEGLDDVGQELDPGSGGVADCSAAGQLAEAAAPMNVASREISVAVTDVPLVPANLLDAGIPAVVLPGAFAVELAASDNGDQLAPALVPPLPAPPPRGPAESHPWQRLAAKMKDAFQGNGPFSAAALEQEAVQQVVSNEQLQQATVEQNGTGPLEPWKSEPLQQAPAAPIRGWRWPQIKFNLRAFLDSLFL